MDLQMGDLSYYLPTRIMSSETPLVSATRSSNKNSVAALAGLQEAPLAEAAPGAIDAQTDSLLGRLARVGRQHGARRSVSTPEPRRI